MKKLRIVGILMLVSMLGVMSVRATYAQDVNDIDLGRSTSNGTVTKVELERAIKTAEEAIIDVEDPAFAREEEYLQNLVNQAKVLVTNFELNHDKELGELTDALNEGAKAMYLISGLARSSQYNRNIPVQLQAEDQLQTTEKGFSGSAGASEVEGREDAQRVETKMEVVMLDETQEGELNAGRAKETTSTASAQIQTAIANEERVRVVKTETAEMSTEQKVASEGQLMKQEDIEKQSENTGEAVVSQDKIEIPKTGMSDEQDQDSPSLVAVVITVCVLALAVVIGVVALVKRVRREM